MKDSTILYVKIDKNNLVNKKTVCIQDIVKLYCSDKSIVKKLNSIVILNIKATKKTLYIFSVLKLFEEINKIYPELIIQNLGEIDFIVQYEPPKKKSKLLEYAKVAFVGLIVFFGAAFTIITFNEDVGIKDIFDMIYRLFDDSYDGQILEISYAIGLPIGIIVFFNHFSKAKITNDPTPMQVQLRIYEEDLDQSIIENANRKGKMIDSN